MKIVDIWYISWITFLTVSMVILLYLDIYFTRWKGDKRNDKN